MPNTEEFNPGQQSVDSMTNEIIQDTMTNLRRMKTFRHQYDSRRAYWYRQYLSQRDAGKYPDNLTPRANIFVPYPRSNVEAVVSRTQDAFFSIDPYLETRGKGPDDQAAAPNMQLCMLSMLHRANFQKHCEVLIRNIAIYGHAGWKVDWDWDFDTVTGPEPMFAMQPIMDMFGQPVLGNDGQPSMLPMINPMTGTPIVLETRVITKQVPRMRPKLIPIDVFDLLLDPDGGQIAHLLDKSFGQLKREAASNPSFYIPGSIEALAKQLSDAATKDPDNVIIRMAEYWNEQDNTVRLITFPEDSDVYAWKDLRYSYRNANYSSYRRPVFTGNPVLLQYGPNPFIHKRAPIVHCSYTMLTGEPYGIGVVESISELTEALNKMSNMVFDNWNMGVNKRYAVDSNADIDQTSLKQFNVPGGIVTTNGDPTKVIFPLPTMTPTPAEFTVLEVVKGMIELSSGISDFYGKGIGGPQGNRTSSGIGQVITESNFLFKMFIRNFERDILQPTLEMCASNIQQFCSDYVEYQVTQAPPNIPKVGRIPLESVIGNFHFDFVAANYATNKVMRQRNLMAFYQLASQTPYANQGEFLRELGKVMEIPNATRLVKPDEQVMQEQQQGIAAQQQAMLIEKILDTESKLLVAGISKKDPNTVTAHAKEVQQVLEQALQEAGQLGTPEGAPPLPKAKEGRTATQQPEGAIPGQGPIGATRSFAQEMGRNAVGPSGLSEMGGTE